MKALQDAIAQRESEYAAALERIEDEADGFEKVLAAARELREAIELCRCLRRLVPTCSVEAIHKAFGAPGDFGYDTLIGDALSRLYRGEP